MAASIPLTPTLHFEVLVSEQPTAYPHDHNELEEAVKYALRSNYAAVKLGQPINNLDLQQHEGRYSSIISVEVTAYTGPANATDIYTLAEVELDARVLALPNIELQGEWNSLVFEDGLPSRLLRFMIRMTCMMNQPGLDTSVYNWNKLCLLYGPPGSGKSTLCHALAQKLSIRLGNTFPHALMVEIDGNELLSKFFGESGKLVTETFRKIQELAADNVLVVVIIDEVETIAGSRQKSSSGLENSDGLRATNQLLKSLDHIRHLPNVIVFCTSNLVEAIDHAFLDRVDNKQYIPSPSPAAIYDIFRSCLNELVRSKLIHSEDHARTVGEDDRSSTSEYAVISEDEDTSTSSCMTSSSTPIPSWNEMYTLRAIDLHSPGCRVWALAQRCQGMSGRTLRRLPILGLAMYTWGGNLTLDDAVTALERAVDDEMKTNPTL